MNRASICFVLASLLCVSVPASQTKSTADTEKAVAALEQKWLEAQRAGNPDILAPLLADSLVNTGVDGKVTGRAETLADIKSIKWASAEYSDVKVRVYGDTAIATGSFRGKGNDASGKPLDQNERWTDTWVKMPGGKWQCVATQASSVK
jgi:ketosteroid isomerase-like protein